MSWNLKDRQGVEKAEKMERTLLVKGTEGEKAVWEAHVRRIFCLLYHFC